MANPQPENGFVKLANEIWNEIIRRDFSKRQKDIILFIWRLSYGCRKKTAYIPMLKDFELCGVGASNITKELKYLVECKVITWDKIKNLFTVTKDYEQWQISPVRGWDEEKFKELLHENLIKITYQNDKSEPPKMMPKIVITYQNDKLRLIKTISVDLSKQEVRLPSNPCRCRVKRVSKDSIKNSIKDISINRRSSSDDFSFPTIYKSYEQNFVDPTDKVKPFDIDELGILFDDYGGEWLLKAMRAACKMGKDKRNLGYVHGTLKGYKERGGPDGDRITSSIQADPPKHTYLSRRDQEMEELRQAKEEAKRLEDFGSDRAL